MRPSKHATPGLQSVAFKLRYILRYVQFIPSLQNFFDDNIDEEKYCGYLHGLGNTYCGLSSLNSNGFTEASQ